jgi:hypothetical protein
MVEEAGHATGFPTETGDFLSHQSKGEVKKISPYERLPPTDTLDTLQNVNNVSAPFKRL